MDNVRRLDLIQTQIAKAFTNIEALIKLESELVDVHRILQKAKGTGNKEVERRSQILIMNIEKSIDEIVSNTHFVKFRKKPKYTVM